MKLSKKKIKMFIVIFLSSIFLIFSITLVNDMYAIIKQKSNITIEIEPGESVLDIARELKKSGAISYPLCFSIYNKLKNRKLKYGTFILNGKNLSYDGITKILSEESKYISAQIAIFEGSNMFNINRDFEKYCSFTLEDLIKELNDEKNYSKYEFIYSMAENFKNLPFPIEGFLKPSNYNVDRNYSLKHISELILKETNDYIKNIKQMYDYTTEKICAKNLYEIFIIASIIQAETNNKEEMPKIASVIYNRLNNGQKIPELGYKKRLECDTTNHYAKKLKKFMEEKHGKIDKELIKGYDSFNREGLTIGPICNPSLEALKAAINPAETKYYFFCTKDNDVYFAENNATHERNLKNIGITIKPKNDIL